MKLARAKNDHAAKVVVVTAAAVVDMAVVAVVMAAAVVTAAVATAAARAANGAVDRVKAIAAARGAPGNSGAQR